MYAYLLIAASLVTADPLPNGTLLFLENCNKFVEVYTEAQIGHVAIVFNDEGGEAWVYEATPDQVRRMTLADYYVDLARLNDRRKQDIVVLAYRPQQAYPAEEVAAMRKFLEEQLGRRYSLKNYVTHQAGDGTHCAELTGNTLNLTTRFDLSEPQHNSPAVLRDKIASQHQPAIKITLPTYETTETWCARANRRWHEWSVWCGWSCREVASFCW